MKSSKRLGIVGGLGAETSCSFCLEINNILREKTGCQPDIVMENVAVPLDIESKMINGELCREMLGLLKKAVIRLNKAGADVINAGNGREAYDIFMKNDDIDLILMDLQLPLMDGFTSTKMIRDSGKEIIIIAQTAYGMTGDREKIMSSGFDDYLIKPISRKQLVDKLISYLQ